MPKKSAKKSIKQRQEQTQNISIKIGELPKKKPRRRPRKGPSAPGREAPMRQLPPVVYQTLPQLTYYSKPNESGAIIAEPPKATSIVGPVKAKTTILEDVGQVGTEGRVEILDIPTKRETLAELITPVDIPRMQVDPVESGPFDIPRMQVDPVESGPFDIPRTQVDPVESFFGLFAEEKPSTIVDKPEMKTTIAEPKQKRQYAKSGKYSKKPEPQRPVSPLTFDESFGIGPQSGYSETQPLYASPMTQRSQSTKFRANSPEGFFTQKAVNQFFEPKKRNTSPKPLPKGGIIEPTIKGAGPVIRKFKVTV